MWSEICKPRPLWLAGTWDYARGRAAQEHPQYAEACDQARRQEWNPWWIRTWADVDAVVVHGCWFSERDALRVCKFFKRWIRASKGKWARKPLPLIDWQVYDFLAPLYGWSRKSGLRRFRRGGLWIPKKNGKSTLTSGLALYHLMKDREPGPEVYTAAGDRSQASIIYDEAQRMAKACTPMAERLRFRNSKKTIEYPAGDGKFVALSAEATLHEGINSSLTLFDELHVQKSRLLWDTLAGAQIAREQPLQLSLSTAGKYDPLSIAWEEWRRGEYIRAGLTTDPSFFSLMYYADEKCDPGDRTNWIAANPSVGVTMYEDHLEELYTAASNSAAKMDQFRQYHLNIWVRGFNRWINTNHWATLGGSYGEKDLLGRRCGAGFDLASVDDTTSLVLWFPDENDEWDGRARFLSYFWLPVENIADLEQKHSAPYTQWADEGWLRLTEGKRVRYKSIEEDIHDIAKKFVISEFRYDPHNALKFAEDLCDYGLTMVPQPQGFRSFSPAIKDSDIDIVEGLVEHPNHPVMNWQIGNCQVQIDTQENWKLVKAFRGMKYKIDGCVSMVQARTAALGEGVLQVGEEGLRRV